VQDRRATGRQAAAELTPIGTRTAPQIAQDGYPEPFTGEILAAGRVKPKSPERTAPAAVRSNNIATAARAARTGQMTAPVPDVMAVLEALQQQVSDLTDVVEAQQRTLERLTGPVARAPVPAIRPTRRGGPGGG
jgi:hypothetical protein